MDRGGRGQLRSCPHCSVSHVKEGRATGSVLALLSCRTLLLLLSLISPLLLSRFAGNHHYLSHPSQGSPFMPQLSC